MTDKKNFLDHVNDKKIESFEKEKFEYKKKSYLPMFIFFFIAIVSIGILSMLLSPESHMVDLTNLTLDEATTWADNQEVMISVSEVYDETIEPNRVLTQNIEAGVKIDDETIVKVVVSKGFDPYGAVVIPAFDSTWSRGSLVNWAEKNGVLNFTIVEQTSDSVEEDYMVSYRLIGALEDDFTRSTEIEFVVNSVTELETIVVPNFLNASLTDLDIWSKNNHVDYTFEFEHSDIYEADSIFYQSIISGDVLSSDNSLHVKISKTYDRIPVEMVNLMNNNISTGEIWLKNNQIPYTIKYQYSSIYPDDYIVDQSFYEGEIVGVDASVQLTVSLGEAFKVVDFTDYSITAAEQYALTSPYEMSILERYSDLVKGTLISQSTEKNHYLQYDDLLTLEYSLGNVVGVVDYRNQPLLQLVDWVDTQNENGATLTLEIIESASSNIQSGYVIEQDIYNDYLSLDGTIHVTISSGLTIPDFNNMSKDEALMFGNQSLLTVNIIEKYSEGYELGAFVSQSIASGQKGDEYTTLDVVYSLGQDLAIPNFTGMILSDIDTWVREQNILGATIELTIYERYDFTIPYGDIISQNIYNVYEKMTTEIEVIVSLGQSYTVPDYRFLTQWSIENNANANDVTVVFEYVQDDDYTSGSFISQDPEPGTVISKKEFIRIKIAE